MASPPIDTPPFVVVDSNSIVEGAWRLDSPAWRVILHQCKAGIIRLVVPEVVLREVVARFSAEEAMKLDKASRIARDLRELSGVDAVKIPELNHSEVVANYETAVRSTLNAFGARIAELPAINIDRVVSRAIARARPFDEKGSGFPDVVLWETFVSLLLSAPAARGVLISKDARAFGAPDGDHSLHPDLTAELNARGASGPVDLFGTVSAYLDATGGEDPRLAAQMAEDLQLHHGVLVALAEAFLENQRLEPASNLRIGARIGKVDGTSVLLAGGGGPSDSVGLFLAHLVVVTRAQFEMSADDQGTPTIGTTTTELRLTGTATYDRAERRFADVRLDLPQLEEVAGLLQTLRRLDMIPTVKVPPDIVEQLDLASKVAVSPDSLKDARRFDGDVAPAQPGDASDTDSGETDPGSRCVSTATAASMLGVSTTTISRAIGRGDIKANRLGARWLVPLTEIDRLSNPRK
jgi:excisionase family DNA binding protein